ncbi:MAG: hypothetical protein AAGE18_12560 [Pseudomonadota bacterium]
MDRLHYPPSEREERAQRDVDDSLLYEPIEVLNSVLSDGADVGVISLERLLHPLTDKGRRLG